MRLGTSDISRKRRGDQPRLPSKRSSSAGICPIPDKRSAIIEANVRDHSLIQIGKGGIRALFADGNVLGTAFHAVLGSLEYWSKVF